MTHPIQGNVFSFFEEQKSLSSHQKNQASLSTKALDNLPIKLDPLHHQPFFTLKIRNFQPIRGGFQPISFPKLNIISEKTIVIDTSFNQQTTVKDSKEEQIDSSSIQKPSSALNVNFFTSSPKNLSIQISSQTDLTALPSIKACIEEDLFIQLNQDKLTEFELLIDQLKHLSPNEILFLTQTLTLLAWGHLKEVEHNLEPHSIQDIAIEIWKLWHDSKQNPEWKQTLEETLKTIVSNHLKNYQVVEIISLARAFDDLNFRPTDLFEKMRFIIQKADHAHGEEAWAVYAFRKLKPVSLNFFHTMIQNMESSQVDHLKLAVLLKALSQVNYEDIQVFRQTSIWIEDYAEGFNALETTYILWAYAHMKWSTKRIEDQTLIENFNYRIYSSLRNNILKNLDLFDEDQIVRIIWSLKKLEVRDLKLFLILSTKVIEKIHHFTSSGIANLVSTLFNTEGMDKNVLQHLALQIKSRSDFSPEETAKMLYAQLFNYCSSNQMEDLIEHLFERINQIQNQIEQNSKLSWKEEDLSQIYIAYCFYLLKSEKTLDLSPQLLTKIENYVNHLINRSSANSSKFQEEVAQDIKQIQSILIPTLASKKISFEEEFFFNGFLLDLVCLESQDEDQSIRFVVEMDGPTHFKLKSKQYREQETVKEEMLKMSNIRLFRIPFHEWQQLDQQQPLSKINYLKKKLSFY